MRNATLVIGTNRNFIINLFYIYDIDKAAYFYCYVLHKQSSYCKLVIVTYCLFNWVARKLKGN